MTRKKPRKFLGFQVIYNKLYLFNLIKIAIPNKISKTPTTIKAIHKILVNSKSKSEVVTVEDRVEDVDVVLLELVELELVLFPKFISTAANV